MNSLTSAVAAVISDPAGRVLLCQQSQGHKLWSLPGGRIRNGESPLNAAVRDIRQEIGADVRLEGIVGIYELTSSGRPEDGLPDCLVHVFRASIDCEVAVNAPGLISRLCWHETSELPAPMTATTRVAIADAVTGRAGVLGVVHRDAEPELLDAVDGAERSPHDGLVESAV
jgi:8-oxo-dGTP diphosphatase